MKPRCRTVAFNKTYGILHCFTNPEGQPTLADCVAIPGIYVAGRLDQNSEGLMNLTLDGWLPNRITDPKHKLPKIYLVGVERIPNEEVLKQLRAGESAAELGFGLDIKGVFGSLTPPMLSRCRSIT